MLRHLSRKCSRWMVLLDRFKAAKLHHLVYHQFLMLTLWLKMNFMAFVNDSIPNHQVEKELWLHDQLIPIIQLSCKIQTSPWEDRFERLYLAVEEEPKQIDLSLDHLILQLSISLTLLIISIKMILKCLFKLESSNLCIRLLNHQLYMLALDLFSIQSRG